MAEFDEFFSLDDVDAFAISSLPRLLRLGTEIQRHVGDESRQTRAAQLCHPAEFVAFGLLGCLVA